MVRGAGGKSKEPNQGNGRFHSARIVDPQTNWSRAFLPSPPPPLFGAGIILVVLENVDQTNNAHAGSYNGLDLLGIEKHTRSRYDSDDPPPCALLSKSFE